MKVYIEFDPHDLDNHLIVTKNKPNNKDLKYVKNVEKDQLFFRNIAVDRNIYYTSVNVQNNCEVLHFLVQNEEGEGMSYSNNMGIFFSETEEGIYELAKENIDNDMYLNDCSNDSQEEVDDLIDELGKTECVKYYSRDGTTYMEVMCRPVS